MQNITQKITNFPKEVVEWIKKTFQPFYQDEVTTYLSQSVDMAEFECRVKMLKHRGLF